MTGEWDPVGKKRARPNNGGPWWSIGEIVSYRIVHLRQFSALFIHLTTY